MYRVAAARIMEFFFKKKNFREKKKSYQRGLKIDDNSSRARRMGDLFFFFFYCFFFSFLLTSIILGVLDSWDRSFKDRSLEKKNLLCTLRLVFFAGPSFLSLPFFFLDSFIFGENLRDLKSRGI